MAAYSTANDPIMQRYIELLQTNPALAQQIDERTAELFGQPELNVYNRGLRNVVTPEGGGADAASRRRCIPRGAACFGVTDGYRGTGCAWCSSNAAS